jgi:hypothetical protein
LNIVNKYKEERAAAALGLARPLTVTMPQRRWHDLCVMLTAAIHHLGVDSVLCARAPKTLEAIGKRLAEQNKHLSLQDAEEKENKMTGEAISSGTYEVGEWKIVSYHGRAYLAGSDCMQQDIDAESLRDLRKCIDMALED